METPRMPWPCWPIPDERQRRKARRPAPPGPPAFTVAAGVRIDDLPSGMRMVRVPSWMRE